MTPSPVLEDLDQNLLDEISRELKKSNSSFTISIHARNKCYFLLCQERDKLNLIYPLSFQEKYRFESSIGLFGFLMENELSYYKNLQEFLSLLQDHIDNAITYVSDIDVQEPETSHLVTQIIPFPRCCRQ